MRTASIIPDVCVTNTESDGALIREYETQLSLLQVFSTYGALGPGGRRDLLSGWLQVTVWWVCPFPEGAGDWWSFPGVTGRWTQIPSPTHTNLILMPMQFLVRLDPENQKGQ